MWWWSEKNRNVVQTRVGLGRYSMIIPVVKLGALALRTFSKPIASRLKKDAGLHPTFRQFIINLAQANHRFTTTIQRRLYEKATDVVIRPLNEERAVQAAAELVGELFLFTVAGAAIIYEVQRSSKAEARKEEQRKRELEAMKQRREALEKEVELLKNKLQEMEQLSKEWRIFDILKFKFGHAFQGHTN